MFNSVTNVLAQWHTNIDKSPFGQSVIGKSFETTSNTSLVIYSYDNKWCLYKHGQVDSVMLKDAKAVVKIQPGFKFTISNAFKCTNLMVGTKNKLYMRALNNPKLCEDTSEKIEKYENTNQDNNSHTFKEIFKNNDWTMYNNHERSVVLKGLVSNDEIKFKNKFLRIHYRDFFEDEDGAELDFFHKDIEMKIKPTISLKSN